MLLLLIEIHTWRLWKLTSNSPVLEKKLTDFDFFLIALQSFSQNVLFHCVLGVCLFMDNLVDFCKASMAQLLCYEVVSYCLFGTFWVLSGHKIFRIHFTLTFTQNECRPKLIERFLRLSKFLITVGFVIFSKL